MHSPSSPKLSPRPSARPTIRTSSVESELAKKRQREAAKRRTGWASTIMTRGVEVGQANTQKAKVLGE